MHRLRLCAVGVLASVATPAWSNIITTVDTGGVGQYTSVVYGTDGLALIAYYDVASGDLKVAHCLDVACTTSTKGTIDSAGDVGRSTSIAIGANGLGIVSYLDVTNGRLKVARCADAACSSASIAVLTGAGPADEGPDIAVPPDQRPVIAFGSGGVLKLARCVDAACSDATALTVSADFGRNPGVAIGGDSLPLVAGDDGNSAGDVRIAHCNDAACTSATFVTLQNPLTEGAQIFFYNYDATLSVTPGGLGVVAYTREVYQPPSRAFGVDYARCADAACSSVDVSSSMLIGLGASSPDPSLAVRSDGRPLVAAAREQDLGRLRVGNCSDPTCYGVLGQDVDGPGAGRFSSVATSPAGVGLVAYHSIDGGGQLKVVYLDDPPEIADVGLTLLGPNGFVGPGQLMRYRHRVQNFGPGTARYSSVTYSLPPEVSLYSTLTTTCTFIPPATVTCPVSDIQAGSTHTPDGPLVRVESVASGSITMEATVSTVSVDPNPSNNSDSYTNTAVPALSVTSSSVIEGDAGLVEARFDVQLVPGGATPPPITAFYSTTGGSASPTLDYLPVSGILTLSVGGPPQSVTVSVVGDVATEVDENFFLGLSSASTVTYDSGVLIVDDDPWAPARAALAHGVTIQGDLAGSAPLGPEDFYAVEVPARASFEIRVDGISADVQPLSVELLNTIGFPEAVASRSPLGGLSMRITTGDVPLLNRSLRVRSGGCTTCGPDDVYRLRAYETTVRIPRFNNSSSQTTVVLLQNTTAEYNSGTMFFWNAEGQVLNSAPVFVQPHGTTVVNTAQYAPGSSGSIAIQHGFPYGGLQGKAVALEPATGFSFDSPLEYRPR